MAEIKSLNLINMLNQEKIDSLEISAANIRKSIIKMLIAGKSGHVPTSHF